jgi:hypothetical protein
VASLLQLITLYLGSLFASPLPGYILGAGHPPSLLLEINRVPGGGDTGGARWRLQQAAASPRASTLHVSARRTHAPVSYPPARPLFGCLPHPFRGAVPSAALPVAARLVAARKDSGITFVTAASSRRWRDASLLFARRRHSSGLQQQRRSSLSSSHSCSSHLAHLLFSPSTARIAFMTLAFLGIIIRNNSQGGCLACPRRGVEASSAAAAASHCRAPGCGCAGAGACMPVPYALLYYKRARRPYPPSPALSRARLPPSLPALKAVPSARPAGITAAYVRRVGKI